jgi:ABC-2 type transport system permease protein
VSTFGYLLLRTARNWILLQLGRLRRVRYLIGLLAGAFYFWLIFFRHVQQAGTETTTMRPEMVAFASLFVALPIAFWWLGKADPRALAFSGAETQLLFPAPLTRRALILYKLGRGQLPVLLNVAIFTLIFLREGPALGAAQRAVGFWILFTTLYLHRLGAALTRLAGASRWGRLIRRAAPAVVIGAALVAISVSLQAAYSRARAARGLEAIIEIFIDTLRTGPAGVVLTPFRALMAPAFTPEPAAWLAAVGVALLILLAHLVWVIRADVAFEDAAVAAASREAERVAERDTGVPRRRSRWRLPRLPLRPVGRPERAILWKNSVPLLDGINIGIVVSAAVLLLLVAFMIAARLPTEVTPGIVLAITALVGLGAATLLGPFAIRDDLRSDLPRLELLRTYPLSGVSIVRMEVLAVAIPIAIFQITLLLVSFFASLGQAAMPIPLGARVAIVLAGALVLPLFALAGVWVQNAVALLFPDWVPMGRTRGGGVESAGQGMLLFGASIIVTLLLLLAPLLAAVPIALLARGLGAWSLVPAAAAAAAAVLALEMKFLLRWLGGVFDRTDPVDAGLG